MLDADVTVLLRKSTRSNRNTNNFHSVFQKNQINKVYESKSLKYFRQNTHQTTLLMKQMATQNVCHTSMVHVRYISCHKQIQTPNKLTYKSKSKIKTTTIYYYIIIKCYSQTLMNIVCYIYIYICNIYTPQQRLNLRYQIPLFSSFPSSLPSFS